MSETPAIIGTFKQYLRVIRPSVESITSTSKIIDKPVGELAKVAFQDILDATYPNSYIDITYEFLVERLMAKWRLNTVRLKEKKPGETLYSHEDHHYVTIVVNPHSEELRGKGQYIGPNYILNAIHRVLYERIRGGQQDVSSRPVLQRESTLITPDDSLLALLSVVGNIVTNRKELGLLTRPQIDKLRLEKKFSNRTWL